MVSLFHRQLRGNDCRAFAMLIDIKTLTNMGYEMEKAEAFKMRYTHGKQTARRRQDCTAPLRRPIQI
jgi:hypothetical protein